MKCGKLTAIACMTALMLVAGNTQTEQVSAKESLFQQLPESFLFSSGVGAWASELELSSDGAFVGSYHDGEMGSTGEGYPGGTVYISNFSGKFTEPEQTGTYTYTMKLDELNVEHEANGYYIKDGVRYEYSVPLGVNDAEDFTIYMPGYPKDNLTEDILYWIRSFEEDFNGSELACYLICNENTQAVFVGYEEQKKESTKESVKESSADDAYIFPDSDQRYLSRQDIAGMSGDDIQQAINEIYARHGRVFHKEEIIAYFTSKDWYHPIQGKTDEQILAEFNSFEQTNVNFLARFL